MSLVYYFDMGNTRGKFWRCQNNKIEDRAVVTHDGNMAKTVASLPFAFANPPDALLGAAVLDEQAISSLVSACHEKWGLLPRFATSTLRHAGVTNAYGENAGKLGVDRWLAVIAVAGAAENVCVVDCGTAITMDVMRADGQHVGGYILPGLGMMADALLRETRGVRFEPLSTESLSLGRNTAEAVMHGALAAIVALIERIVGDKKMRLVLTGGDAVRLSPHLACPHLVEPELLLQGLQRYFADVGIN